MKATHRKPQKPRYSGIHGGVIGNDPPRVEVTVAKEASPAKSAAGASARADAANALEAALQKTETGRQLLTLLEEVARLRIHEQLVAELARGSAEDVERLKRVLCGRDLIARE